MHTYLLFLALIYFIRQASTSTTFPIPATGHHLYLQHRAGGGTNAMALPPVARRQMETMPSSAEREPSCQELRSMWRHMRRMGRQMEFTNEIPKIQDPFTASAVRYSGGRRRPSKYPDPNPYSAAKSTIANKESLFHSKGQFGAMLKDQNEVLEPSRIVMPIDNMPDSPVGFREFDDFPGQKAISGGPRGRMVPGRFADSPLPEEALGVYGTVVNSPEERARFRAKSRGPPSYTELRGFRGVPPFDSTGLGRVPFRASAPHPQYHYGSVVTERRGFAEFPQEIGQRANGLGARVERVDRIAMDGKLKNTCLRLQNRTCQTDVDCFCNGNPKLFCGGGRCRPLFKAAKYGKQKWGKNWMTDSYERSLLGFAPKRDPVWPGPF